MAPDAPPWIVYVVVCLGIFSFCVYFVAAVLTVIKKVCWCNDDDDDSDAGNNIQYSIVDPTERTALIA